MTAAPRLERRRRSRRAPLASFARRCSRLGAWALAWPLLLPLVAGCSAGELTVAQVQGSGALSPRVGESVTVTGVVTAVLDHRAFFLQSIEADRSKRTSDGVRVRRGGGAPQGSEQAGSGPTLERGDVVRVRGTVEEEQRSASELPVTVLVVAPKLDGDPSLAAGVEVIARDQPLPRAVAAPDAGALDTAPESLAAWEAREGMLVELGPFTVIGPPTSFGEVAVLPDAAAERAPRTARGGLLDDDPDRPRYEGLLLDDAVAELGALAGAAVGDRLEQRLVGIVDYRFGAYRLYPLDPPAALATGGTQPEVAPDRTGGELVIATLNVENLDPGDPPSRFRDLALFVVERLRSPDLLLLQEVQDDSGPLDDGVTSSDQTLRRLIDGISVAGGPPYSFRYVRPENGADGGEPGGNIRTALLLRRAADLRFVDHPPLGNGGRRDTGAVAHVGERGVELRPSPARVAPQHRAFAQSRKPLAVELRVGDTPLWLIGVHLVSKRADDPIAGSHRPPRRRSAVQRTAQAREVAGLVRALLDHDANAHVVVLGDFNDGVDSSAIEELERVGLVDLTAAVPADDRYTYVFQGRSQLLDHVLASPALQACCTPSVDVVHGNAESPAARRVSDHDPVVARFEMGTVRPPIGGNGAVER